MLRSKPKLWKRTKWWLYWLHRWTGIGLCVLFAIWFISGVVMMYVPFPSFRAEERVAKVSPIAWQHVRIGPQAALASLDGASFPDELRLEMTSGEPVYRAITDGKRSAISALTGARISPVDASEAKRIASAFARAPAASVELVDHDQWVVTRAYARIAPFWRVRIDDGRGTDLYVTQATGEIVQNTDRQERFWNWLGAVPHWIYFDALRIHQEPWRQTIIWTSGIGIVGAILGIWIGILRLRPTRRYKSGSISPYRGWMKWHHLAGLVGGIFLVTWVFSGWLSMSPFGGFGSGDAEDIAARYAGSKDRGFAATDLNRLRHTARGTVELRFEFIGGHPVIIAVRRDGEMNVLDGQSAMAIHPDQLALTRLARKAVPSGSLTEATLMTKHDLYWYTTGDPRQDSRRLPVLRFKFADAAQSWLYIDPATGQIIGQSSNGRRTYRWLFSALHSFDLPALLAIRPARDGLMIVLSIAGLIISISGIIVGWKYFTRTMKPPRRPSASNSNLANFNAGRAD